MDNVLEYFIKNPEKEFHIRELAKLTRRSPTTISKYLKNFEKQNLLKSRKKFKHILFKANTDSLSFKDLKIYTNINNLRRSGLIEYLIDEFNHPETIVLFGSYRKGEDIQISDIDILTITTLKKKIDLEKFEKFLNRKIQLFLYSNNEIDKMKTNNKELLNNMINGIVLYGFWEVFK